MKRSLCYTVRQSNMACERSIVNDVHAPVGLCVILVYLSGDLSLSAWLSSCHCSLVYLKTVEWLVNMRLCICISVKQIWSVSFIQQFKGIVLKNVTDLIIFLTFIHSVQYRIRMEYFL